MQINYGLVAVTEDKKIVHFCGYEFPPSLIDREILKEELLTDKEFGLTETHFIIVDATEEVVNDFRVIAYECGVKSIQ